MDWLRQRGAEVIEIDTDGIYFKPPKDAMWDGLYKELAATLPRGIEVEFDARYTAMFSYKAKNYALLSEDGKLSIKGAALKSRGLEKFQRVFIERAVRALLEGKPEAIPSMHAEFAKALREREWAPEMFAKTEALQDSPEAYQRKSPLLRGTDRPLSNLPCAARAKCRPAIGFPTTSRGRKKRSRPTRAPSW